MISVQYRANWLYHVWAAYISYGSNDLLDSKFCEENDVVRDLDERSVVAHEFRLWPLRVC